MSMCFWLASVIKRIAIYSFIGLTIVCILISCGQPKQNHTGESLAKSYCTSCHAFPEPSLLDKKTWKAEVLPLMGFYLGIKSADQSTGWDRPLEPLPGMPKEPTLSEDDWKLIVEFYQKQAPDSLVVPKKLIDTNFKNFEVVSIPAQGVSNPAVSFIHIDTSNKRPSVLVADLNLQMLSKFSPAFIKKDSIQIKDGAIVNLTVEQNGLFLCNVGVLSPNNGTSGRSQQVYYDSKGNYLLDTFSLLKELARPVQIIPYDLDADGLKDYLVCEFGHLAGALSWRKNVGNNKYEKKVIRAVPGAINAIIRDVNADGLPDIYALFSQADEGIFLYINKGKGNFDEHRILRFPPSYGSSSFEMVDFNKDGLEDIIYTCGDNSDFSRVFKPYHGVYIYLNKGNNQFEQKYFYQINGCYKTITSDFDKDGDMDIATISFFADYANSPEEGFVYLQNEGKYEFKAFSFPQSIKGRWLTMAAGDIDNDGDLDIAIGNLSVGPYNTRPINNWSDGPEFIVLKNKLITAKQK